MKLERLKELAGMQLTEKVEIPADVSIEKLESMMDGARRALGIANKLKDPVEKKKHLSQVMGGLNRIRAALKRMIGSEVTESVDTELMEADAKIHWSTFNVINGIVGQRLTKGEEDTLSVEEVETLNRLISDMVGAAGKINTMFYNAQERFKKKK